MTEDEIRAYLCRWVMEFGTGQTTATKRLMNDWYQQGKVPTYEHGAVRPYFKGSPHALQINEAGLALIKGDN